MIVKALQGIWQDLVSRVYHQLVSIYIISLLLTLKGINLTVLWLVGGITPRGDT